MNRAPWLRVGLPLFIPLVGVPLPASAEQPAHAPRPLSHYEALWSQPLFAPPSAPVETEPSAEPLDAAVASPILRLAGWGKVGNVETAIAWDSGRGISVLLDKRSGSHGNRLIRFQPGHPGSTARALIRWEGKDLWISATPGEDFVEPASTVDSRAADLDGPVLFTADATMEDLISSLRPGIKTSRSGGN
jgi:hypothetical protein